MNSDMNSDTAETPSKPFALRGLTSFFVGGTNQRLEFAPSDKVALAMGAEQRPLEQSGDYQVGQMYVQGYLSADRNGIPPLLMWHGGGMTGSTWESTPDGRPGWLELALRDGFDAYVSDAPERGRSSVPPNALADLPVVFRPKELAWRIFRMGPEGGYATRPETRKFFDNQRFPVSAYDTFCNHFVARWPALAPLVEAAYSEYLKAFDKAVLMGHSQGCGFVQAAALGQPERVHAVILVEPSGSPAVLDAEALRQLKGVPHLVIWGDFFNQSPVWQDYRRTVEVYLEALRAADVRVDVIDLPAMGITGNSHFPMMDDNNAAVWLMISDWIQDL